MCPQLGARKDGCILISTKAVKAPARTRCCVEGVCVYDGALRYHASQHITMSSSDRRRYRSCAPAVRRVSHDALHVFDVAAGGHQAQQRLPLAELQLREGRTASPPFLEGERRAGLREPNGLVFWRAEACCSVLAHWSQSKCYMGCWKERSNVFKQFRVISCQERQRGFHSQSKHGSVAQYVCRSSGLQSSVV